MVNSLQKNMALQIKSTKFINLVLIQISNSAMKRFLLSGKSKDSSNVSTSVQSRPDSPGCYTESWPCTVPHRAGPGSLCSWSTGLTLRKYPCYNVQLRRCKSANHLHLQLEQLLGTCQRFLRKNKIKIYNYVSNKTEYYLRVICSSETSVILLYQWKF